MTVTHGHLKSWRRTVAVALAAVLMSSTAAFAQTATPEQTKPLTIEKSMKAIIAAESRKETRVRPQGKAVVLGALGQSTKTTGGFVAALGAVGGFFGGGLLGAKLEPDCHCDDPGLRGFLIGAPIGAIAGGVLGWKLSGR